MSSAVLPSQDRARILVLGGSYAGLAVAGNLIDLSEGRSSRLGFDSSVPGLVTPIDITIVDERDGFYHLIGSPLALVDEKYVPEAWQQFKDIPGLRHPDVRFMHGSVCSVDYHTKVAAIIPHGSEAALEQKYDYLVAATGLRRSWPTVPQELTKEGYVAEAQAHIRRVRNAEHGVVVIGGGAVGIEMAAELKHVEPTADVTLIHSRDKLLSSEPLPDEYKDRTLSMLQASGVKVITAKRVVATTTSKADPDKQILVLSDGTEMTTSHVITAISKPTATATYLPKDVLDPEGLVKIRPTLHFDAPSLPSEYHYAIGDMIARSSIKRCGSAMFMGHLAAYNIHQHILLGKKAITEVDYKTIPEYDPAIVIALGGDALAYSAEGGIKSGQDIIQRFFENDLGLGICWKILGLSEEPPRPIRQA